GVALLQVAIGRKKGDVRHGRARRQKGSGGGRLVRHGRGRGEAGGARGRQGHHRVAQSRQAGGGGEADRQGRRARDPGRHQRRRGNIKDLDIATAMTAMDAKFWIAFRVAKAATIAKDGSLTFVSGGLSQRPAAGASIIAAINGALEKMSVGLALEFAPIRVNTVSPGPVDTPMWDRYTAEQKKKFLDGAASHVPLKRVAHPDEIAELVMFFMTNRFVTGTVVPLDGGSSRA